MNGGNEEHIDGREREGHFVPGNDGAITENKGGQEKTRKE